MHLFGISPQRVNSTLSISGLLFFEFRLVIVVAVAELIEFEVSILAVGITLYGLQATEQQCLTQHSQIL